MGSCGIDLRRCGLSALVVHSPSADRRPIPQSPRAHGPAGALIGGETWGGPSSGRPSKCLAASRPPFHGSGAYGDELLAFAVALASGASTAGQQLDLSAPDPVGITAGIAWPEQPLLPLTGFLSAGCPKIFRNGVRQVGPARLVVVGHSRQAIAQRVRSKVNCVSRNPDPRSRHVGVLNTGERLGLDRTGLESSYREGPGTASIDGGHRGRLARAAAAPLRFRRGSHCPGRVLCLCADPAPRPRIRRPAGAMGGGGRLVRPLYASAGAVSCHQPTSSLSADRLRALGWRGPTGREPAGRAAAHPLRDPRPAHHHPRFLLVLPLGLQ
jgi:hypothetical protein